VSRFLRLVLPALAVVFVFVGRPALAVDDNVIVIGDTQVLRIRADSGGFTAKQRADALRKRLIEIYQQIVTSGRALKPEEVTLDLTPGKPSIRVRGMLLLSVTQDDAKVNGNSTLEDLAQLWHARLRDALIRNAPLSPGSQYNDPYADPGADFP
jgi:hypothetical protein